LETSWPGTFIRRLKPIDARDNNTYEIQKVCTDFFVNVISVESPRFVTKFITESAFVSSCWYFSKPANVSVSLQTGQFGTCSLVEESFEPVVMHQLLRPALGEVWCSKKIFGLIGWTFVKQAKATREIPGISDSGRVVYR
jgi:hypothetical protein